MWAVLAGALVAILVNAAVVAAVVVGVAGREVPEWIDWIWIAFGPVLAVIVGVLSLRRRRLRPWFYGLVIGNVVWFAVLIAASA